MSTSLKEQASSSGDPVCVVRDLGYSYGSHVALSSLDLTVGGGEIVAILGPNGSGKTTLFRLLCTLMPLQRGTIHIGGMDCRTQPMAVRNQIGIVFQSPSLDVKLTVDENLAFQGALYGLKGANLERRRNELLERLQLQDRRGDYCGTLSGGLKRRVELAKGMLHQPRLLLLDEPSTGLDPSARLSFWDAIRSMADEGMSILLTTHLLDEADKADRVMIMNQGAVVAQGEPLKLRAEMGQGIITIAVDDVDSAHEKLAEELGLDFLKMEPLKMHHQLRLQSDAPASVVPLLVETLGDRAQTISIGRPSLEDVFIAKTGRQFVA